jgi:phosphate transport system substrate-binding protein
MVRPTQRAWKSSKLILLSCLLLIASLLASCSQSTGNSITLTGSTSITPFVEHLAELYMHEHPGITINVQGLGSSAGIQAAQNGTAEIGMSSRNLEANEADDLEQLVIAYDALAIIVHPQNAINTLEREQVRDLFDGDIQSWESLTNNSHSVTLVSREAGSGTYSAFDELLMDKHLISNRALRQGSNGAIRQIVADNPDAIGYISLGIVDSSVKAIAIDGVSPAPENVHNQSYTLIRPFLFVWPKGSALSPEAQAFIDYVLSPEGQLELEKSGLVQRGNQ